MGGKTFTPLAQNWKWFQDNAAEPTVQIANENTTANLSSLTAIIRLRQAIAETGNANGTNLTFTLQYSLNDSSWTAFGASNHWNYANGQGTEGNNITGFLLSDTDELGEYAESGTNVDTISALAVHEVDFAIAPTANVVANQDYYFRVHLDGTEVPLNSGETHAQVHTPLAPISINIFEAPTVTDVIVKTELIHNININEVPTVTDVPTVQMAPEFVVTLSSNIATSGEITTFQLTPPAGKTSSNFTTGRIQDDENPADAIDIADGNYTEIEWNIKSTTDAILTQYDFQIVYGTATPLDTYTLTPQLTLEAAGGDRSINVFDSVDASEFTKEELSVQISVAECTDTEDGIA